TTPPQLRRRLGRVRPPEVKSFMARNAARSVAVHVCAVGDAREHATGHDQLVRVIMGIGPLKRPPAAVDAGVRLRVAPISAHALMRRSVPGVRPPMRPPVAASNLRAPVQVAACRAGFLAAVALENPAAVHPRNRHELTKSPPREILPSRSMGRRRGPVAPLLHVVRVAVSAPILLLRAIVNGANGGHLNLRASKSPTGQAGPSWCGHVSRQTGDSVQSVEKYAARGICVREPRGGGA